MDSCSAAVVRRSYAFVRPRLLVGSLLLALLSGCAHGKGSREHWQGISTGATGDCAPLDFQITVDEGRIEGWAMSEFPGGAVSWDVRGSVTPDNRVSVETITQDPRVRLRRITWSGVWKLLELTFEQTAPDACQPPRAARLRRP